jgi:rhamnulokinase
VAKFEESLASTTQLYDPRTRTWSGQLLEALGLPAEIFPPVIPSGVVLGGLRPELAGETGLRDLEVVASCSHDTGAAVAAVPASGQNWAYLSSGTWSLMGVESPVPVINDASRQLNFTNEIGYGGSVRLLKNIIGLWLVQECRREWAKAGAAYDYGALTRLASEAPPFVSLINPADQRFIAPGDMPGRIAAMCQETGQPVPATPGAYLRCILESLALLYRRTLGRVEQLVGQKVERLHIVGGGSRNTLLNQFSANALQIPVLAGPVEATALGNLLVQAIALGHLKSLAEARQVLRQSFELELVEPADQDQWEEAYARFERIAPA